MEISKPLSKPLINVLVMILALTYVYIIAIGISVTILLAVTSVVLLLSLNLIREELHNRRKLIIFFAISLLSLYYMKENGFEFLIDRWETYDSYKESSLNRAILMIYLCLTNGLIWTTFITVFLPKKES